MSSHILLQMKPTRHNGWSSLYSVNWRKREWLLTQYVAGVCDHIPPHSTALLTALQACCGGQGAPTSCHQSDRRQLSPYIWRPRGLHTSTPSRVHDQVFFLHSASEKWSYSGCNAQGKWNVSLVMALRKSANRLVKQPCLLSPPSNQSLMSL